MIATILIILLIIGVVFLAGNLVMMRRENQQLREDLSGTVPLRKYAGHYVPEQWQPTEEHLRDPRERDTPEPPSSPAS